MTEEDKSHAAKKIINVLGDAIRIVLYVAIGWVLFLVAWAWFTDLPLIEKVQMYLFDWL